MNRPCLSFFSILSLVVAGQAIARGEGAVEPRASNNIALHCPVSFGVAPNYPRRARGPEDLTVLTDGRLCEGEGMMWLQAGSVGWSYVTPVAITVDLGKVEAISGVGIHLAAGASNTQWPLRILILVSDDGKNFYDVGDLVAMSVQAVPETGYATHWYSTDRLQTHGRFLKLLIEGAGEFRYAIADEVEVRPGDIAWVSLPFSGDPIGDATAYFWKTGVQRRVGLRIGADLESARKIVSASKSAVSKEPFLARLKELNARLKDPAALALPDNRAILPLNDLHRDL
ncbi:MAG: discoidin domain-containing protein, partial [Phycisphaerae bacterium]